MIRPAPRHSPTTATAPAPATATAHAWPRQPHPDGVAAPDLGWEVVPGSGHRTATDIGWT